MKRLFLLLLISAFCLHSAYAALGIGPATRDVDFTSAATYTFNYNVISDDSQQDIELYTEGDLAQYTTLSKTKMTGPGTFSVTITFPDKVDLPGKHLLIVGAREKPREDVFIGATINIRAVIYVYVPYPGQYAEIKLTIPNANSGDKVPVEAYVINRGKETLNVNNKIEFYNAGNLIETMQFEPVTLTTGQERYFRRYLDSSDYKPGVYFAKAVVDYGTISEANATFRIGSLFVNVTNFTQRITPGSIEKFFINIESQWNNPLPSVFADVNLTNGVQNVSFRTPSISLEPWSFGTLTGYVDAKELMGTYDATVSLFYGETSTTVNGEVIVAKESLTVYLIVGICVVIVAFIIVLVLRRKKKR